MFVERYIKVAPSWAKLCEPITLSKLLAICANPATHHVSVRMLEDSDKAFIAIANKGLGIKTKFQYWAIHRQFWLSVAHTITSYPTECPCWLCRWRIKHQRYPERRDFEHLYLPRKQSC